MEQMGLSSPSCVRWYPALQEHELEWGLPDEDMDPSGHKVQTADPGVLKWFSGQMEQMRLSSPSYVRWYPALQEHELEWGLPDGDMDPSGHKVQNADPGVL